MQGHYGEFTFDFYLLQTHHDGPTISLGPTKSKEHIKIDNEMLTSYKSRRQFNQLRSTSTVCILRPRQHGLSYISFAITRKYGLQIRTRLEKYLREPLGRCISVISVERYKVKTSYNELRLTRIRVNLKPNEEHAKGS